MNPSTNKQAVIATIAKSPQGVGLDTISISVPQIPRRTLQRLLNELVKDGQLIRMGKTRATVYAVASLSGIPQADDDYATFIPLSDTSRDLLFRLRKPVAARIPVAYSREWLAKYEPNKTFYLDENTRGLLRRIGDTGMEDSPVGTYGREILDRLLIDLSWASSRLEGNTYTRLDTEKLIRYGEEAVGKDALETQMILNHKHAIEMLVESAKEIGFNRYTFLNLHGLLSENLMPDPTASGRLRMREVHISGTVYMPCAIPQVIEDCFHSILNKAELIRDPFEQAFFILVHIPYLQPFEDVNKRVERIGSNIAFIKHNLCPLTFLEVPERAYVESLLGVYELQRVDLLRDVFVWAYERSAQRYIQVKKTLAEPEPVRLKYRSQLHQLVGDVVRTQQTQYSAIVEQYAQQIVESDRLIFIAMALDDIRRLHEGVLVRYKLTLNEFRAWKDKQHV